MDATRPPLTAGRPIVFSDLDRTLFFSLNALYLDGEDADAPALRVAEIHEGRPIAYITVAAHELLGDLAATHHFVPVTTRTSAQYRRMLIPGPLPRYAITGNGGTILRDGVVDGDWTARIDAILACSAAPLEEIARELRREEFAVWMLRLRDAEKRFLYAVVDRTAITAEVLDGLTDWCHERGWAVSLQGRKLYCVPHGITKHDALAEVALRLGGGPTLAAGDSLLDQGMLLAADRALRPAHGELESTGFTHGKLTVTTGRGVRAGEEIVRGMRSWADAASPSDC
ncbi:HAD family hydrolase [Paeniglutamicibacter cryotolerans]|uniref:HAD family hydrolase n=1 Tax=Paeniglutamicibacter cryotolerans TaxID=670079 RepID=A0A839QH49_9MICC|nr:HAD family hydrolase [Paeniglutamicibacter cryotolerans]MBB2995220.1 hypothetical protein [Paeniglutamicibacter cryotolerans]